MLCNVILPFLFLPICQTDETLAAYAPRDVPFQLVEMQGEAVTFKAMLSFPGRKQYRLDTPCASLVGRINAPLPWFETPKIAVDLSKCNQSEKIEAVLHALNAATLAEATEDVILLSDDEGETLVFRRLD